MRYQPAVFRPVFVPIQVLYEITVPASFPMDEEPPPAFAAAAGRLWSEYERDRRTARNINSNCGINPFMTGGHACVCISSEIN
jgi:hypothetical protein